MAVKLGILGGIGSGKSVVSQLLRTMNIPVYDSDSEAKRLNVTHPLIRRQLTQLVGQQLYASDGSLQKEVLADYLFASRQHAEQVNAIVHPVVCADFAAWAAARSAMPCVAVECALLMESGLHREVDHIVLVSAPFESRVAWAMKRDNATRQAIEARINQQMSDDAARRVAHFVIENNGKQAIITQVMAMLQAFNIT